MKKIISFFTGFLLLASLACAKNPEKIPADTKITYIRSGMWNPTIEISIYANGKVEFLGSTENKIKTKTIPQEKVALLLGQANHMNFFSTTDNLENKHPDSLKNKNRRRSGGCTDAPAYSIAIISNSKKNDLSIHSCRGLFSANCDKDIYDCEQLYTVEDFRNLEKLILDFVQVDDWIHYENELNGERWKNGI